MKFSVAITASALAAGAFAAPADPEVKQILKEVQSTVSDPTSNLPAVPVVPGLPDLSEFSGQAKPVVKILKKMMVEVQSQTSTITSAVPGLDTITNGAAGSTELLGKLTSLVSLAQKGQLTDVVEGGLSSITGGLGARSQVTSTTASELKEQFQTITSNIKSSKLQAKLAQFEEKLDQVLDEKVEDKLEHKLNGRDLDIVSIQTVTQGSCRKVVTSISSATNELGDLTSVSLAAGDVTGVAAMVVGLVLEVASTVQSVSTTTGTPVDTLLGVSQPLLVQVMSNLLAVLGGLGGLGEVTDLV